MKLLFDLRCWAVGWYADCDLLGLEIGPLGVQWDFPNQRLAWLCRSWCLGRWVIRAWKLEIRLELDLGIWRLGYMMAAPWDHGLYCGPLNLQIEYDVLYDWDRR